MKAGQLNRILEIWNTTLAAATGGNQTATSALDGTIYAEVEELSSGEQVKLGTIGFMVTHRIVCRYTSLIKSSTILKLGTRELHVSSVRNLGSRNRELEILAQETTSDA